MRKLPQLPRKVWIGLGFFYLAGIGWIICLVMPFTHSTHKVVIAVTALGLAEVSFLVGLAFIGKTYYKALKDKYMEFLRGKQR